MGVKRGVYRVLMGDLKEREHLEDTGVEERIILRWIFRKWDVGAWSGSSCLTTGKGGGHLCIMYLLIAVGLSPNAVMNLRVL
jgi:hypothetical protein